MRAWIAGLALIVATPALAQDAMLRNVRDFGNATAQDASGPDRIMTFGRQGGQVVVTGMTVSPAESWPDLAQGTNAVMRTRASAGEGNRMPADADFDYVRRHPVRLFIVGTWSAPPAIWEIVRNDGGVRFREIGADSKPGPWLTPMIAPAGAR